MKNTINKLDDLNRRMLIKGFASSYLGLNFTAKLFADNQFMINKNPTAKSVIFIKVIGGMSHVDTFDIKEVNKNAIKIRILIVSKAILLMSPSLLQRGMKFLTSLPLVYSPLKSGYPEIF